MIIAGLSSFVASFGFGIIFNIRGRNLILAGIGGGIGGFVHYLCQTLGCGEVMALFIASIAFSIYSEICARLQKSPVTTFIICALIPLVPGGGMYRMMFHAINKESILALQTCMETLGAAGTLALGAIFVSTIMRLITTKSYKKNMR